MSDQTTPRTYRDVLLPIVGADALREAEARVYDQYHSGIGGARYACAEGFCAAGIILRELGITYHDKPVRFPISIDFPNAIYDESGALDAVREIIGANDTGDLATPGSLTALLDSAVL